MDKQQAFRVVSAAVQQLELKHQDWVAVTNALVALKPEDPKPKAAKEPIKKGKK